MFVKIIINKTFSYSKCFEPSQGYKRQDSTFQCFFVSTGWQAIHIGNKRGLQKNEDPAQGRYWDH